MKLAIKNGLVVASHNNNQNIKELYPNCEIIWIPDGVKLDKPLQKEGDDPLIDTESDPRINWSLKDNKINAKSVIEDIAEEYRA